ncbi:MAG: hypothetical protein JSV88_09095 [Candidatus Aminicenantes bacterium]|nr:MAG: hypothetical protein JSV88_09095 [Candidatus Aminicenantes bacterium]
MTGKPASYDYQVIKKAFISFIPTAAAANKPVENNRSRIRGLHAQEK